MTVNYCTMSFIKFFIKSFYTKIFETNYFYILELYITLSKNKSVFGVNIFSVTY